MDVQGIHLQLRAIDYVGSLEKTGVPTQFTFSVGLRSGKELTFKFADEGKARAERKAVVHALQSDA